MLTRMDLTQKTNSREENQLHGSISRSEGAQTMTNEGKVNPAQQHPEGELRSRSLTHQQESTGDKQHLHQGGNTHISLQLTG